MKKKFLNGHCPFRGGGGRPLCFFLQKKLSPIFAEFFPLSGFSATLLCTKYFQLFPILSKHSPPASVSFPSSPMKREPWSRLYYSNCNLCAPSPHMCLESLSLTFEQANVSLQIICCDPMTVYSLESPDHRRCMSGYVTHQFLLQESLLWLLQSADQ